MGGWAIRDLNLCIVNKWRLQSVSQSETWIKLLNLTERTAVSRIIAKIGKFELPQSSCLHKMGGSI